MMSKTLGRVTPIRAAVYFLAAVTDLGWLTVTPRHTVRPWTR